MNQSRRAAARRQDDLIMRSYPKLRREIAQEKNRYIRKCAESYRRTSHLKDDDFYEHERQIAQSLYTQYLKIGRSMHVEVSGEIKGQRPALEYKAQSRFEFVLQRWARAEAGRKAKPIAGTTRKDINRAVQRAYADEESEANVIRDILAVRGYSAFRADAVARTETHNGAMFASKTTAEGFAQDEEVTMKKVWSPTVDDRSREYHLAMEDHPPIPMDALFDVENPNGGTDRMDRPGDPSAPPEQVINCRCVLTYEVE